MQQEEEHLNEEVQTEVGEFQQVGENDGSEGCLKSYSHVHSVGQPDGHAEVYSEVSQACIFNLRL